MLSSINAPQLLVVMAGPGQLVCIVVVSSTGCKCFICAIKALCGALSVHHMRMCGHTVHMPLFLRLPALHVPLLHAGGLMLQAFFPDSALQQS